MLRLKGKKYEHVLEIACGTGIVTRQLRDAFPASTEIVATDLNPDMFEFAKPKFEDDENVRWQQADASALPFPDASFEAVVCQFGFMFVPDKGTAMREGYRVLSRDGLFLFNVWDSFDANPFAEIAHSTITSFFDHDPPNFYQIPFSLYDSKLVRELLQNAGFERVESFSEEKPCRSSSAKEFATGLVRGNPVGTEATERGVNPHLPPTPKRQITRVSRQKQTKAIDAGQPRVSVFASEKSNLFVLWRGDHARGAGS